MRPILARFTLAAATAALLASCGGGGGGGGSPVPPIGGGPQAVAISDANAKPVSADALDSVRNTSTTSGPSGLPLGVSVDPAPSAGIMQSMLGAAQLAAAAPRAPTPMGVMMSQSVACPLGGSMMMSGNFATTTGTSPGDTFTINASGCTVSEGGVTAVMNGQMSLTIVSGSMDTMPFHVVLQMTMTNLSVTSGGVTTVANGDARMDWNAMSGMSQTMVSSGTTMTMRETSATGTRNSTMTNYTQGITLGGTMVSATLSASVQTDNPRFAAGGATYVVSTPSPVVWDATTGVVSSGSIKVVGASNSQLMLDFTGGGNAMISLDANGDGIFEKTMPTTVAELEGLR